MKRKGILQAYCCLIVVLIVSLNALLPHTTDFQIGFTIGAALGTEILSGIWILKFDKSLKSAEALKQLFIQENDERCKYIKSQIGSIGLNIDLVILALATIVSGFFNITVFYTLLCSLFCTALVKGSLKLYYRNKI